MLLLLLLSRFSRVWLWRPHRRQPARLPRPWDSPGKNTGVGCHFLLQCMKVKSESEVAQSCLTLSDPMDCSPPGSSIHGIFQARVLEWGAIAFSAQSCPILCDSKDSSMPGFPVLHYLLEFAQAHVHWFGDASQPSHPLPPSPFAFNLSQDQGLFQWVSSSHQVAKVLDSASASVLPVNIQDWFPLGWTGWISLQSKGLSRVFSNTKVQNHQFFSAQLSLWYSSHIHTWLLEKA